MVMRACCDALRHMHGMWQQAVKQVVQQTWQQDAWHITVVHITVVHITVVHSRPEASAATVD